MPVCQMLVNGYEGWLNSSNINSSYKNEASQKNKPIDCMWIVNVTKGWKVREGIYPSIISFILTLCVCTDMPVNYVLIYQLITY